MYYRQRFEIRDAITQAFRLPGGKGLLLKLVLWGSFFLFLSYLIFGQAILRAYFEMFGKMMALQGTLEENPAQIMEAMGPLYAAMGWGVILSILVWVIMASVETAMHRNIFRPHLKPGFFPLRFGMDEIRVMLAQLVVYLICMGVYFVGYFVVFILVLLAVALGESVGGAGAALGIILSVLAVFALIIAALYILARLSPAAALSVRDEDVRTIEGWRVTKGLEWPLIGSYLIVGVVGNIILSVVMMIGMVLLFSATNLPGLFTGLEGNDDPNLAVEQFSSALFAPGALFAISFTLFIVSVVGLLWYMAFWGISNYVAQLDMRKSEGREYEYESL